MRRIASCLTALFLLVSACAPEAAPSSAGAPTTTTTTTAPAATAARGGSVTVALVSLPASLDPHELTSTLQMSITGHVFEGLLGYDEQGVPKPVLARSYQWSDDGKTLTFALRTDVKFQNGQTMGAADVVSSLNRIGSRSGYAKTDWARVVTGVNATDTSTVQIQLNEPFGPLVSYLAHAFAAILPADIAEAAMGRTLTPDELIGTGPYTIRDIRPGIEVALERFSNYVPDTAPSSGETGAKHAYLDSIVFIPVPEASTRVAALETGDVQVADEVPRVELDRLGSTPGIKLSPALKLQLSPVLNHQNPPLDNPKIRQAITYALDKKAIMLAIADGRESAIELDPSFFPADSPFHTTAAKEFYERYDLDKAKQLLAEAGYAGEPLIFLTTQERSEYYQMGLAVKDQLAKIGINVQIDSYDFTTIRERRNTSSNWHMYPFGAEDFSDPVYWGIIFLCNSGFYPKYCNPQMDSLFTQVNGETDLEQRQRLWSQIEVLNWEDGLYLRVGNTLGFRGYSDALHDFPGDSTVQLWNVWFRN